MLDGIDTSNNNGVVNWNEVKADGAQFALTKLTEGAGYLDPTFAHNWSEMARVGFVRGLYHFARPDYNTTAQEAQYFLSKLPTLQPGDIVALDMEYPWDARLDPFDYNSWALTWLQTVEKALGFPPLVYSYPWYITNRLTSPALAHYPLWLAAYQATVPASVGVWPSVTLWQHSSTASYPGIYGQVDEDWISRTPDGLKTLGKPATTLRMSNPNGETLRNDPIAQEPGVGAVIPYGTPLTRLGGPPNFETTHWIDVRVPDGRTGWVLKSNTATF
jgi:GH25 family lysozyme M1 (1,4-beta-N-acetylmuramidase)